MNELIEKYASWFREKMHWQECDRLDRMLTYFRVECRKEAFAEAREKVLKEIDIYDDRGYLADTRIDLVKDTFNTVFDELMEEK